MPLPNTMHQFARLKFASFALRVPPQWQDPVGDPHQEHYNSKTFKPEQKTTMPEMTIQPMLFSPATPNKYHTDTQKMLTSRFDKYMKDMLAAIANAWKQWQSLATMTGIMITGPVASIGQIVGPPLLPLIMLQAPKTSPMLLKYSNVIAQVISSSWMTFTATVKIPGMPWYPAFAAFPGPVAPPMPNVPVPFAALTQVPVSIGAELMKQQMVAQLADPNAPYAPQLFAAICDAFEKVYNIWKASTMVTQVMGTGPIPTFAPPYVPVGPVVGGMGNMLPGGFVNPGLDIPPLPAPQEFNS